MSLPALLYAGGKKIRVVAWGDESRQRHDHYYYDGRTFEWDGENTSLLVTLHRLMVELPSENKNGWHKEVVDTIYVRGNLDAGDTRMVDAYFVSSEEPYDILSVL